MTATTLTRRLDRVDAAIAARPAPTRSGLTVADLGILAPADREFIADARERCPVGANGKPDLSQLGDAELDRFAGIAVLLAVYGQVIERSGDLGMVGNRRGELTAEEQACLDGYLRRCASGIGVDLDRLTVPEIEDVAALFRIMRAGRTDAGNQSTGAGGALAAAPERISK